MNTMAIKERPFKISQNDQISHYDARNPNRRNALNDYDSHFKIAFSLRDNSGLCKPLLNSELRLMAYFEICSCLTNLFNNFR